MNILLDSSKALTDCDLTVSGAMCDMEYAIDTTYVGWLCMLPPFRCTDTTHNGVFTIHFPGFPFSKPPRHDSPLPYLVVMADG